MNQRLDPVYWALRLTFGLVPLLAGLDKFFGLLADWEGYIAPAFAGLLPFSPGTFMAIVGIVEIAVGLAVLTRFTRLGAYAAMAWLVLVAVNLVAAGILDVAVRDLAMAVAAFALARLEEVRAAAPQAARAGAGRTSASPA